MEIREDDLTGDAIRTLLAADAIRTLLAAHLADMRRITPPGSVHALDVGGLRAPGVTLWSAWEGSVLLGCGALQELDAACGEIKAMRTAEAHRRRGVASRILEHILREARRRGYRRLYLETGATATFAAARALYARYGFAVRGPFGAYADDPHSVFMAREL